MNYADNQLPPNYIFLYLNHESEVVVTSWEELVKPPISPQAVEDRVTVHYVSLCVCRNKLMGKQDNHLQPRHGNGVIGLAQDRWILFPKLRKQKQIADTTWIVFVSEFVSGWRWYLWCVKSHRHMIYRWIYNHICWVVVSVLTIGHRVDPVLVETGGDRVHLCCARRLLQLPPLLRQGALHHGRLGEGAVWVLMDKVRTDVGTNVEKQKRKRLSQLH